MAKYEFVKLRLIGKRNCEDLAAAVWNTRDEMGDELFIAKKKFVMAGQNRIAYIDVKVALFPKEEKT